MSFDDASEVQGERRIELARVMLSRSLHSLLQLVCVGKGKAIMLNDLYKNPYVPIIVQPLAAIVQLFVQVLGFLPYSKH